MLIQCSRSYNDALTLGLGVPYIELSYGTCVWTTGGRLCSDCKQFCGLISLISKVSSDWVCCTYLMHKVETITVV